jgi:hypothetical protein
MSAAIAGASPSAAQTSPESTTASRPAPTHNPDSEVPPSLNKGACRPTQARPSATEAVDGNLLAKIRNIVYTYSYWRNPAALGQPIERRDEKLRLFETFRSQPDRRGEIWADFFIPIACNPLKRLDSEK